MAQFLSLDILIQLLCSTNILFKNLNPIPEVCLPAKGNSFITSREFSFITNLCLKPECVNEDSEYQHSELSVNIEQLAYLLNISSDYEYCVTPGCVKAAVEIMSKLNESVKPCDDFYQFACGGWLNSHKVPASETSFSVDNEIEDTIEHQLRGFLESKKTENEPNYVHHLKSLYDDCIEKNLMKSKSDDYENVKNAFKWIGGWPVLEQENWNSSTFDWIDSLIRLHNYNYNFLINIYPTQDVKNRTVYMIKALSENSTHLLRGQNDSSIDAYFDGMVETARTLGANMCTSVDELREALNFEIKLSELYLQLKESLNGSTVNNSYTLQELIDEVPELDWLKFLNGLLQEETVENETLFSMDMNFVNNFVDLITKTNKRVVANYLVWKVITQDFPRLSKKNKTLKYESEEIIRKKCINSIKNTEGSYLGSYYMEHYLKKETKKDILNIFKYVHSEFLNIIENTKWLDVETKRRAKDKVYAMKLYIGNPKDPQAFINVSDLYKNLDRTDFDKQVNISAGFREDEQDNDDGAFEVNGSYITDENAIALPAAYLLHPNFNKDRPQYLNFAAIGWIIGHEIAHAFDANSRHFEQHCNNVSCFSKEAAENFEERTKCFIEQYNNYTDIYGRKVDGNMTLDENIADSGSLKAAYRAYLSWVRDHKSEGKLPGLMHYTQDQLFFIGRASVMCEKYTHEHTFDESHVPEEVRLLGMMSNMPEFAEAFHCSKDSAMNRENKCQVW